MSDLYSSYIYPWYAVVETRFPAKNLNGRLQVSEHNMGRFRVEMEIEFARSSHVAFTCGDIKKPQKVVKVFKYDFREQCDAGHFPQLICRELRAALNLTSAGCILYDKITKKAKKNKNRWSIHYAFGNVHYVQYQLNYEK